MQNAYLLEAISPVAHGDPGLVNESNFAPSRLRPVFFDRTRYQSIPEAVSANDYERQARNISELEASVSDLSRLFPLPDGPKHKGLLMALLNLKAEWFCSVALIKAIIVDLNAKEPYGEAGLYRGVKRYDMLLKRIAIATSSSGSSLFEFYSLLLNSLDISNPLNGMQPYLSSFMGLPLGFQQSMLQSLSGQSQSLLGLARSWYDTRPAKTGNSEAVDAPAFLPGFEVSGSGDGAEVYYNPTGRIMNQSLLDNEVECLVPTLSASTLRHELRRVQVEHLLQETGFGSVLDTVHGGLDRQLPRWVVQLLANGGHMADKATAPDTATNVSYSVMQLLPHLELLSGVFPTHIAGPGKLSCDITTMCIQNNPVTERYGWTSQHDAANLLFTHHGGSQPPEGMPHDRASGQMLYAFQAIKSRTRFVVEASFGMGASELCRGAFYFGLQRWIEEGAPIGGHRAQGFGRLSLLTQSKLTGPYMGDDSGLLASQYENYISDNRERLASHLRAGTLGWSKPLDKLIIPKPTGQNRQEDSADEGE